MMMMMTIIVIIIINIKLTYTSSCILPSCALRRPTFGGSVRESQPTVNNVALIVISLELKQHATCVSCNHIYSSILVL